MFGKLKAAWKESQERLTVQQLTKTILLSVDAAKALGHEASPNKLYVLPIGHSLRVEVRMTKKMGVDCVSFIERDVKRSETFARWSANEKAAFEAVLTHLRNDPDCR